MYLCWPDIPLMQELRKDGENGRAEGKSKTGDRPGV